MKKIKKRTVAEMVEYNYDPEIRILFRSDLTIKQIIKRRKRVLRMLSAKDSDAHYWFFTPVSMGDANYMATPIKREKTKIPAMDILWRITLAISVASLLISILSLLIRALLLI